MVNYKRVVCEVAVVAALLAVAAAAPADCRGAHYDQRQNGSENYRLNIDGVVIAVAPADSLLAAASDIDIGDLLDLYDAGEEHKPKPPAAIDAPFKPSSDAKPDDAKPEDAKPDEAKPDDSKPEAPAKPADAPLSDVSLSTENKGQKKEASTRKQENAQRLKNKIAHLLLPLLRRNKHH